MPSLSRRSLLTALGGLLPFGVRRADASPGTLSFRPFEDAVRDALSRGVLREGRAFRAEVGDCDLVRAGLQGCHNARPFAGLPAGRLRIVRTGSAPGPSTRGVRLYVSTVDLILVETPGQELNPARALDFAAIPPAPALG